MLDRPLLNSVWKERISRVLEIEDRRYSIFIESDILASFSFEPVPNAAVKALTRANKKRNLFIQYPYFPCGVYRFCPFIVRSSCRGRHYEAKQDQGEAIGSV